MLAGKQRFVVRSKRETDPSVSCSDTYVCHFCSLSGNGIGEAGGVALADALKVNQSITDLK